MEFKKRFSLLLSVLMSIQGALCCCETDELEWSTPSGTSTIKVPLAGWSYLLVDIFPCNTILYEELIEYSLTIVKRNGEIETYFLENSHYVGNFSEGSFSYYGNCYFGCIMDIYIHPTDFRYDCAELYPQVNLLSCDRTLNTSVSFTLHIEGPPEAPLDVVVDVVSSESVNVYWSPPFTLHGVPILHYTVNVVSQGTLTEQINTNETHITLERPCTSTTYHISGWNEVGEGSAAVYEFSVMQVVAKHTSDPGGMCVSCSFPSSSTAEGCAIKLRNDKHIFSFNLSRQTYDELIVLECFTVPEAGVFSVLMCEVELGGVIKYHIACEQPDVIIHAGLPEAPLAVVVDVVSSESVNVSWSPPFTLHGVPILHYTVNVVSQGTLTEQINTTETHITLERPCTSTTYQISAWNEVGEGGAAEYNFTLMQVVVKGTSDPGGMCVSCSFPSSSTSEGCAIKLRNDKHIFSFNLSRQKYDELILLECFKVSEAGVFSVLMYEVELGGVIGYHIACEQPDVVINAGLPEAPLDLVVDVVSSESVNVSWSPPFTLDEIPILHYTVNVTSQGTLNEQINTTETHITLERPCTSTTYQISGWNEVGEGRAAEYNFTLIEVVVKGTSDPGEVCVSCSFPSDSTAEGCAIQLQNDEHTFSFNVSRQKYEELILLECLTVPEAGVFSVLLYEVELDGAIGYHITCKVSDVIINTVNETQKESCAVTTSLTNTHADTAVVTGLSIALGILVTCVIAVMMVILIVFTRRNMAMRRKNTTEAPNRTSINQQIESVSHKLTGSTHGPLYANIQLPIIDTDDEHMYDVVETGHMTAAKHQAIELSDNAAYGRHHRTT